MLERSALEWLVVDGDLALLRAHRQAQVIERLLVGVGYDDRGYVFARPDDSPWKPDSIGQAHRRIIGGLGLRMIALHDLRHTTASPLLHSETPLNVVSDSLGHATPATRFHLRALTAGPSDRCSEPFAAL